MPKGILHAFVHKEVQHAVAVVFKGINQHQTIADIVNEHDRAYPFLAYHRHWLKDLSYHLESDSIVRYLEHPKTQHANKAVFLEDFLDFLCRSSKTGMLLENDKLIADFRNDVISMARDPSISLQNLKGKLLQIYKQRFKEYFSASFLRDIGNAYDFNGVPAQKTLPFQTQNSMYDLSVLPDFWSAQSPQLNVELQEYCQKFLNQGLLVKDDFSTLSVLHTPVVESQLDMIGHFKHSVWIQISNTTENDMTFEVHHAFNFSGESKSVDSKKASFHPNSLSYVSQAQKTFMHYHLRLRIKKEPNEEALNVSIEKGIVTITDPYIYYYYVQEMYRTHAFRPAGSIQDTLAVNGELSVLHHNILQTVMLYLQIEQALSKQDWQGLLALLCHSNDTEAEYRRFCFAGILRRLGMESDYALSNLKGIAGIKKILLQSELLNILDEDLLLNLSVHNEDIADLILKEHKCVSDQMLTRLLQYYPDFWSRYCSRKNSIALTLGLTKNYYSRLNKEILKNVLLGTRGKSLVTAIDFVFKDEKLRSQLSECHEQELLFILKEVPRALLLALPRTSKITKILRHLEDPARSDTEMQGLLLEPFELIKSAHEHWMAQRSDHPMVKMVLSEPIFDYLLNVIEEGGAASIFSYEAKLLERMKLDSEVITNDPHLKRYNEADHLPVDYTPLKMLDPEVKCAQFFFACILQESEKLSELSKDKIWKSCVSDKKYYKHFLRNQSTAQLINFLLRMESEIYNIDVNLREIWINEANDCLIQQNSKFDFITQAASIDWSLVVSFLKEQVLLTPQTHSALRMTAINQFYQTVLTEPSTLRHIIDPLVRAIGESSELNQVRLHSNADGMRTQPSRNHLLSLASNTGLVLIRLAELSKDPGSFFMALHASNPERARVFYRQISQMGTVDEIIPNSTPTLLNMFLLSSLLPQYQALSEKITSNLQLTLLLLKSLTSSALIELSPKRLLAVFRLASRIFEGDNVALLTEIRSVQEKILKFILDKESCLYLFVLCADKESLGLLANHCDDLPEFFMKVFEMDSNQGILLHEYLKEKKLEKSIIPENHPELLIKFFVMLVDNEPFKSLKVLFQANKSCVFQLFKTIHEKGRYPALSLECLITLYGLTFKYRSNTSPEEKALCTDVENNILKQEEKILQIITGDISSTRWTTMIPALLKREGYKPTLYAKVKEMLPNLNSKQLSFLLESLSQHQELLGCLNSSRIMSLLLKVKWLPSNYSQTWFVALISNESMHQLRQGVFEFVPPANYEYTDFKNHVLALALEAESQQFRDDFFKEHPECRQDARLQHLLPKTESKPNGSLVVSSLPLKKITLGEQGQSSFEPVGINGASPF